MAEVEVCDADVVSQPTSQHAHLVVVNAIVGHIKCNKCLSASKSTSQAPVIKQQSESSARPPGSWFA